MLYRISWDGYMHLKFKTRSTLWLLPFRCFCCVCLFYLLIDFLAMPNNKTCEIVLMNWYIPLVLRKRRVELLKGWDIAWFAIEQFWIQLTALLAIHIKYLWILCTCRDLNYHHRIYHDPLFNKCLLIDRLAMRNNKTCEIGWMNWNILLAIWKRRV
jgi:hypothetical protein